MMKGFISMFTTHTSLFLGLIIFKTSILYSVTPKIVDFDMGGTTACALFDNGMIKCWGYNGGGALGQGDTIDRGDDPSEMGDNLPFIHLGQDFFAVSVGVGFGHVCAKSLDGRLKCWGSNGFGGLGHDHFESLGDNDFETGDGIPAVDFTAEAATDGSLQKVSVGGTHTCVLFESGRVKCWGGNRLGQLGIESNEPSVLRNSSRFIDLPYRFVDVFAGTTKTCLLSDQNQLFCFGNNSIGSLGLGRGGDVGMNPGDMAQLQPVDLGTNSRITSVSPEDLHACVSFAEHPPKCFGANYSGQLGLVNTIRAVGGYPEDMGANLRSPQFPGFSSTILSTGMYYSCGLNQLLGSVSCWGHNNLGQLGLGTTMGYGIASEDFTAPVKTVELGTGEFATKVKSSFRTSCVMLKGKVEEADRKIKCWGNNARGQLGQGFLRNIGDEPNELGDSLSYIDL